MMQNSSVSCSIPCFNNHSSVWQEWDFLVMNFIVPLVDFQKFVILKLIWVDSMLGNVNNVSSERRGVGKEISPEHVHYTLRWGVCLGDLPEPSLPHLRWILIASIKSIRIFWVYFYCLLSFWHTVKYHKEPGNRSQAHLLEGPGCSGLAGRTVKVLFPAASGRSSI